MKDFTSSRDKILKGLQSDLMGPGITDKEISLKEIKDGSFVAEDIKYSHFIIKGTDQELFTGDVQDGSPTKRYSIGILYPQNSSFSQEDVNEDSLSKITADKDERELLNDFEIRTKNIKNLKNANIEENLDLVGANLQRPSVQGITFKVSKRDTSSFIKIFSKNCGRYEKIKINQKKKLDKDKESKSNSEKEIVEKNFWIRKPCYFEEEFLISKILEKRILKKEIKDT